MPTIRRSTETDLVRACREWLASRGCFVWRQNSGAMQGEHKGKGWFMRFTSEKGVSDIIGMLPGGRFLAVECKVGRNRLSDDQADFLRRVGGHGGLGIVVYSVEELAEKMRGALT